MWVRAWLTVDKNKCNIEDTIFFSPFVCRHGCGSHTLGWRKKNLIHWNTPLVHWERPHSTDVKMRQVRNTGGDSLLRLDSSTYTVPGPEIQIHINPQLKIVPDKCTIHSYWVNLAESSSGQLFKGITEHFPKVKLYTCFQSPKSLLGTNGFGAKFQWIVLVSHSGF